MANKTKKRSWKWVILITGVIVLAALGLWYVKIRGDNTPQYLTAQITSGSLTQLVTATGTLNPETNVQVGCQISGVITKLFVDWNSAVTKGQLVAQIDPASYQADLDSADGNVANAQAALELAQVNAKRAQELFDSKLIPRSDYDTAIATLNQSEATVKVDQAAVEKARVNLAYCTIYSPVDGTVISRNVDIGQTVAASLNAPVLFQIANDLTKMQIDSNVAEADVGGVEEGQRVNFSADAFPYRTFHGTVVQIRNSPIIVQNVVTYDTVISVNNDDLKLRPGMTANVNIIIAHRDNALKIPNSALRFHPLEALQTKTNGTASASAATGGGGSHPGGSPGQHSKGEHSPSRTVYVLKGNKLQPTQIRIGITDGIYTEVTDGLSENDQVVTSAIYRSGGSSAQPNNPFGGMRRF
jgi:HlyD family secretion protein